MALDAPLPLSLLFCKMELIIIMGTVCCSVIFLGSGVSGRVLRWGENRSAFHCGTRAAQDPAPGPGRKGPWDLAAGWCVRPHISWRLMAMPFPRTRIPESHQEQETGQSAKRGVRCLVLS